MLNKAPNTPEEQLIGQVKTYLKAELGEFFHAKPWPDTSHIPVYLTASYALYRVMIWNHPFTGLVDRTRGRWTATTVAKQAQQVDSIRNLPGVHSIFITRACSYHQRRQLIDHKVNFIVPGNQLYLRPLGVILQERFKQEMEPVTELGTAATLLVLKALTGKEQHFTPSTAAPAMGYTAMTLTRAFNELEATGLARCQDLGRQRVLEFQAQGRELWEKAKPLLPTPVQHRYWVAAGEAPQGPVAGIPALADLTPLSEPGGSTVAIDRRGWRNWLAHHSVVLMPREIPGAPEVQVWKYPPDQFAKDGHVDPFSLYLSLRQEPDERVEQALEQVERSLW